MASLLFFLLLIAFLLVTSLSTSEVRFQHVASDVIPAAGALVVKNDVTSNEECSLFCINTPSCVSFAYANETGDCRLYASLLGPDDPAVTKTGFNYYARRRETQMIGQACNANSDCDHAVKNAECRAGKCQCIIGYHFFPGPGTCVKKCWRYGTGFYKVPGECLNGNNDLAVMRHISFQECWHLCLRDPGCRTFEHSYTRCFGSYSTKLEKQADWKQCGPLSYHQRDCA